MSDQATGGKPAEKLAAAGFTVAELKTLLGQQ